MPSAAALAVWQVHARGDVMFPVPEGGYWLYEAFADQVWSPSREAAGFPGLAVRPPAHRAYAADK